MKNYLIEDKKAKSKSFFLRNESTIFNRKFITFLESNYLKYTKYTDTFDYLKMKFILKF